MFEGFKMINWFNAAGFFGTMHDVKGNVLAGFGQAKHCIALHCGKAERGIFEEGHIQLENKEKTNFTLAHRQGLVSSHPNLQNGRTEKR